MAKLYTLLCVAQLAAIFAIYYYTGLGLRDSYIGAQTLSKGIAFALMLLIGLVAISKPIRAKLGIWGTKRDTLQIVSFAIVSPLLTLTIGQCIAMTFGGLGGDF
ncbi:hypothetical protein BH11CYA1_BH11CYA1_10550 [soil metagenome]